MINLLNRAIFAGGKWEKKEDLKVIADSLKKAVPLHICEENLIGSIWLEEKNFFYKVCKVCGDEVEVFSDDRFIEKEELEDCKIIYGKTPGKDPDKK